MRPGALLLLALLLPGSCDRPTAPSPTPPDARGDERTGLPVDTVCPRCGFRGGENHLCGRTRWCDSCYRDIGEDHICGKTGYCSACGRETGDGHSCGCTAICWSRQCRALGRVIEKGTNHICGRTRFCERCRKEAMYSETQDPPTHHDCILGTYACPRCEMEVTPEHVCGKSRFCPDCKRAASLPVACTRHPLAAEESCPDCVFPHRCAETYYCAACKKEQRVTHHHRPGDNP